MNELLDNLYDEIKTELKDFYIKNKGEDLDTIKEDFIDEKLNEIVDSNVPIYNYDIVKCALENIDLVLEVPEFMAFGGETTPLNGIAANLYNKLYNEGLEMVDDLIGELEDNQEEIY